MKLRSFGCLLVLLGLLVRGMPAQAGESSVVTSDWPQWRGPTRDSISPETGLALDWNAQPPREMWTAEVGNGLACVLVVKNRAFTTGWSSIHGGETSVWGFNAETGALLWKHSYPDVRFLSGDHGLPDPKTLVGPNATPCGWRPDLFFDVIRPRLLPAHRYRRGHLGARPARRHWRGSK